MFKQPRVPEYRESEGTSSYIRKLVLFLKDFCLDCWTAVRSAEQAAKNGGKIDSVNGKTGDVVLNAGDVGALPSGGTAVNASKLGGKAPAYYVRPVNLLDNGDFTQPVNQRGKTSYTGSGYMIDRWTQYQFGSVKINSGYITLTDAGSGSSWFRQRIPHSALLGKNLTFAVKEKNGTVSVVTATYPSSAPAANTTLAQAVSTNFTLNLTANTGYGMAQLRMGTGKSADLLWAALYEGTYTADTLPPYTPKGYAYELLECQRYYYRTIGQGYGYCNNVNSARLNIPIPVMMRATPNIDGSVTFTVHNEGSMIDNLTGTVAQMYGAFIRLNISGTTALKQYTTIAGYASAEFGFSAEL